MPTLLLQGFRKLSQSSQIIPIRLVAGSRWDRKGCCVERREGLYLSSASAVVTWGWDGTVSECFLIVQRNL